MKTLYLDIETEGLNPFEAPVVTAQILNGKVHIVEGDAIVELKSVLESSFVVGHNLKFEQKFLKHHYGISLNHVYDTWLAEIAISGGMQAGRRGTGLKDLAKKYCNIEMSKEAQTSFKKGQSLTQEQIEYAALDVQVLPEIYKAQQERIEALNLEDTINIEMAALPGIAWLELSGMPINTVMLEDLRIKTLDRKYKALNAALDILKEGNKEAQRTLTGEQVFDINLNSPDQLKEILNNIGIPCTSTAEAELKKFTHPVIDLILEYKEAEKLLNTFIEKQPRFIDSSTGRIHANFNQYGAHSGRFTCNKPNLQQQPNSLEWRSIYRAAPGNKIVTADYSQIELRILAQVSGDSAFIEAYRNGQDLHSLTASKIFHKPLDEVTKQERQVAKTVNFGTVYGIGAKGLKGNLENAGIKITEEQAKQFIRGFYKGYSGVDRYLNNAQKQGLENCYIRNAANRFIKFDAPTDEKQESYIRRQSQNMPIQSLCADMVKISIANLHKMLEPEGVRFINCVHDELVFECKEDQADYVADIVRFEMEKAGSLYLNKVPAVAEVSVSDSWSK
jgi:DNA polymerase I-like protein with 3'-5' exonuclease and polymerase domains